MILALERAAAFVHRGLRIAQERVVIELNAVLELIGALQKAGVTL